MTSTLRIDADHADAMADEQVRLTISGARPSEQITVHSRQSMNDGDLWESELVFEADEHGQVDLASAAPISGPYSDPHPMGFLWSMSRTKTPDHTPKPELSLAPPITVDVMVRGAEGRAELTLTRRYLADDVTRTEVRDRGLIGTLFEPNGARPNPVVISLGGSEGGLNEPRAALLASHGFSSLALAYFGVGHLPPGLREVPLEYFQTAFDYLIAEGICEPGSIAIEGGSYGGELVLLLAARFPEVNCTIAHAPSGVLHSSVDVEGAIEATSAWSVDGEPLPFVQFGANAIDWTRPVISLAPGYRACLEQGDDLSPATIEVEKAVGPILLFSGADDQMWASEDLANVAAERLRSHDFAHHFEHIVYEDAGHLATTAPYVPTNNPSQIHPMVGLEFAFGGTTIGNLRSSEDSWKRELELLNATLKPDASL